MPESLLGPLVTEVDVDLYVIETLKLRLPGHLRQLEIERGFTAGLLTRPAPGSISNTLDDDEFPDHQLPAIIVTTAQTEGEPELTGNRDINAWWQVVVSSIVRGKTPPETRYVAALFNGAVRRLLVQNGSLEGKASGVTWAGSLIRPVADTTDKGRYLAAGVNTFHVLVDRVMNEMAGPGVIYDDDPAIPYDPPITVDTVTVDVIGVPIQEIA